MKNFHDKFVVVKLKGVVQSIQGILDATKYPILRVNNQEFEEKNVSSYSVGQNKDKREL